MWYHAVGFKPSNSTSMVHGLLHRKLDLNRFDRVEYLLVTWITTTTKITTITITMIITITAITTILFLL